MLYPIRNKFRSFIELNDFWKFKIDRDKIGEKEKWYKGFQSDLEIAVPGSWNEQLEELGLLFYVGSTWYYKKVFMPEEIKNKRIVLRVGSADFNSKVWINGNLIGENNQGFLPFEFDITEKVTTGENFDLVIMVNNELNGETIPQGISSENYVQENRLREETYPSARFDFAPFGGINRPVIIYTTPHDFISKIKVDTKILSQKIGQANIEVTCNNNFSNEINFEISDPQSASSKSEKIKEHTANTEIKIDSCRFWSNRDPYLYDLNIKLLKEGDVIDEYSLPIGIREIRITDNKIFLNDEEIYLKGFGKHEDYSVIGKGLFLPLIVKDFELMKWINANSFRTSHYPYSDEIMFYADRKGILVIDEVPAVSLDFRFVNQKTLENHKESLRRLIERDYNHPSIIMWAAGNEPNLVGEPSYYDGSGKKYWGDIFNYTRSLDKSRPVTVPNCTRAGVDDPVFEFCDIISINRYYGWYEYPGKIEYAVKILGDEMDLIYKKYRKPMIMTEFGVDTVSGLHSTSDQMFTEEYQAKYLEEYIKLFRTKSYMVGEHVWNFADFRTPQHFRRVIMNLKGVFSRERAPKFAAFKLKEIWGKNE
ncbi:MAG: beta-glucuronidase [Ignavibacteriales bacterium]|nr:beta-glucuronidase [Ignavibacteriales bacterium]